MIGTGRIGSNFGWTSGSIDASLLLEQFSFALLLGCGVAKRDGEVDGHVDGLGGSVVDVHIDGGLLIVSLGEIDVGGEGAIFCWIYRAPIQSFVGRADLDGPCCGSGDLDGFNGVGVRRGRIDV